MLSNLSDWELLNMMSKGKPDSDNAFKVIYKRYSSQVHSYCYKLIRDRQATEDLYQETFIKFYQNASNSKVNSSVSGLIFTTARNLCFNYLRDKKTTIELDEFHLYENNNEIEQKESYKYINLAIDLLDLEYREPFILRMYDGLNYNEIAEICKISSDTARQRVFRAKEKMKKFLEPYFKEKIKSN